MRRLPDGKRGYLSSFCYDCVNSLSIYSIPNPHTSTVFKEKKEEKSIIGKYFDGEKIRWIGKYIPTNTNSKMQNCNKHNDERMLLVF